MTTLDRIIGEAIMAGLVTKRSDLFKVLKNFEATALSVGPDDMLANVMTEFQRMKHGS